MISRVQGIIESLRGRPRGSPGLDSNPRLEAGIDEVDVPALISSLGLVENGQPFREHPGWRPPRRVLVMECPAWRLDWLQRAAPGVELVSPAFQDIHRLVEDADAVIGWWTQEMLDRGATLRWLHYHKAGIDELQGVGTITDRSIVVTTPARLASPVIAEHAFAILLALLRQVGPFSAHQRAKHWSQADINDRGLGTLFGKTLLVTGLGGIGSEVIRRAKAFGMRTMAIRMSAGAVWPESVDELVPAEELLTRIGEADVVLNALPLTDKTRGFFQSTVFDACKRGAIFVNVARGGSVVTRDLVTALASGRLGGAALDVTDPEPLPADHPLWRMPNVVLTPHVAAWSEDTTKWSWIVVRENLKRYIAGERMLSVLEMKRGY